MNIINNINAAAKTAVATVRHSAPVRGVKRFAHNVRVEFEAQRIVAATKRIDEENARVRAMSQPELDEYVADNAEILRRAYELRHGKK